MYNVEGCLFWSGNINLIMIIGEMVRHNISWKDNASTISQWSWYLTDICLCLSLQRVSWLLLDTILHWWTQRCLPHVSQLQKSYWSIRQTKLDTLRLLLNDNVVWLCWGKCIDMPMTYFWLHWLHFLLMTRSGVKNTLYIILNNFFFPV